MSIIYSNLKLEGKAGSIVKMLRVNDLLFLVILLGVMEKWVAEPLLLHYQAPVQLNTWMLVLLIAAVVLIAAGGHVINDYFDVKIDAINNPDELVITKQVSKKEAMLIFQIATGLGLACGLTAAWVLQSMALATVFILVPGVLWFYSSSYKRMFLVGNLIIASLFALVPMVIALANWAAINLNYGEEALGGLFLSHQIICWIGCFSLFLFCCTWIREQVKDIEEQNGDRELECHTFPVKYGDLATKIFATVLIAGTCALISYFNFALLPIDFAWGNFATRFYLMLLVALVCELWLLWAAELPSDYRHAQLLMKFIMFMGAMFAFCVPKLLAAC